MLLHIWSGSFLTTTCREIGLCIPSSERAHWGSFWVLFQTGTAQVGLQSLHSSQGSAKSTGANSYKHLLGAKNWGCDLQSVPSLARETDKKCLIIQLLHYNWDKSSYKGEKGDWKRVCRGDVSGGGGNSSLRKWVLRKWFQSLTELGKHTTYTRVKHLKALTPWKGVWWSDGSWDCTCGSSLGLPGFVSPAPYCLLRFHLKQTSSQSPLSWGFHIKATRPQSLPRPFPRHCPREG